MTARRLFLGLLPDAAVRRAIVSHRERWAWPAGQRFTAPEKLHITLHFLGNVDAEREIALLMQLRRVAVEPVDIVLRHAEVWRNGVAALQPEPAPQLSELHARLGELLRGIGLEPEARPWRPHVTLARDAQRALPPGAFPPIHWQVTEFALVWSQLGAGGGYHVLARRGASA